MERDPTSEPEAPAQPLAESLRQSFRSKTALAIRDNISPGRAGDSSLSGCELDFRTPQSEEPFPEAWLAYLHENVFIYRFLSDVYQAQLRQAVRYFIASKFWEGCAGLRITEELQVTIAGQAC